MKNFSTLLIAFFSTFLWGQNPDLFNYQWTITQIDWNGVSYTAPTLVNFPTTTSRLFPNGQASLNYVNSVWGTFNYSSANSIENPGCACTLIAYTGPNWMEATDFDNRHCYFYLGDVQPKQYTYTINNIGANKNLVITDTTSSNKIYYNGTLLGTSEAVKRESKVFPNPARDFVSVQTDSPTEVIEIYDVSGKLISKFNNLKGKEQKIDVSSLSKGVYYLVINGNETTKFIKK